MTDIYDLMRVADELLATRLQQAANFVPQYQMPTPAEFCSAHDEADEIEWDRKNTMDRFE